MAEKKQGMNFYELGRKSGATTSKTQQSGLQALVGSIDRTVGGMLKQSKAATAALTAAMPSGVAIEKVPEQLRGQVSKYLADNKKEYTDAAAIIASGINPQSQRYKDAVEKMNSVSSKFENLSNNLESIAVARKAALDDPSYSAMTTNEDALIYSNLANGSLYETMSINEDGTFNYKDANGNNQLFSDFRVQKQGFTGQQGYLALVENARQMASKKGMTFDSLREGYQTTINTLFDKLGPRGALDYAFADKNFLNQYLERPEIKSRYEGKDKDEFINNLKKNPGNFVEEYKKHNMTELENAYNKAPKYEEEFKGTRQYYDQLSKSKQIEKDLNSMYDDTYGKKGAQGPTQDRFSQNTLGFVKNLMPQAQFKIEKNNDGSQSLMILEGYKDPNTNEDSVRYRKVQNIINPDGSLNKLQFGNIEGLLRINNVI